VELHLISSIRLQFILLLIIKTAGVCSSLSTLSPQLESLYNAIKVFNDVFHITSDTVFQHVWFLPIWNEPISEEREPTI